MLRKKQCVIGVILLDRQIGRLPRIQKLSNKDVWPIQRG